MRSPVLETKLYAARVRGRSVPRPRLTNRLTEGATGRLVLVSAPAGFGKTTALAQWVQTLQSESDRQASGRESDASSAPRNHPSARAEEPRADGAGPAVAWLSLDTSDNDPRTFCRYLLAALHAAVPALATDPGGVDPQALGGPAPEHATSVLADLLNDVADLADDVVLVLDDYHVITAPQVHEQLIFLIEHAPPQLHIAVATRADPPLPLARLRVRGDLTEVRAAHLRFTTTETHAFFNDAMRLQLTESQVTSLETRAEGWIAALQLAALSMDGRDDLDAFIAGFSGDDRYIVDYLVEEVLQRQPDAVRTFLLDTAVLDRLTGPLCDALTGREDGHRTLEALERANMFLVPLDNQRRWYRYHHLFADVLRARGLAERPDRVPQMHRAASRWYFQNGQLGAAIDHALAGHDTDLAANLIQSAIEQSRLERTEATMRSWLQQLPPEVVAARPALGVALAGARLASGQTDGVADLLDEADRRLAGIEESADLDTVTRQAPGWVEVYRSGLAQANHDTAGTLRHARTALDRLDPGDDIGGAAASALLGLASWAQGDLGVGHDAYAASQTNFKTAGFLTDVLGCAVVLANIRKSQGRLHDALAAHIEALNFVTDRLTAKRHLDPTLGHDHASAVNSLRGIVDTYVGMADIHRERGDLDEAARLLHVAETAGDRAGLPQARYRSHVVAAQLQQAHGNLAAADALLGTAQRLYVDDFHPDVAPVAATRARLWVRQGRIDDALAWARSRHLRLLDDVAFLRDYEHLTLVRAELAALAQDRTPAKGPGTRTRLEKVLDLLERILGAATAGGCYGTVVDALIQQAIALRLSTSSGGLKRSDASLQSLERALSLAEPEGYARVFLDEGAAVLTLLDEAARAGIHPDYVRRLRQQQSGTDRSSASVFDSSNGSHERVGLTTGSGADAGARAGAGAGEPVVVESLSPRELDVLRLLASELNGPDIARELVLSLNTIRTHTKNIYAKLGVTNRRAAVRRAHELKLLRAHMSR